MKPHEFDKCLAELERTVPTERREVASEIFWAACLIGIDRRLVKAVAALVKRPDMSTGQLMKAAGVTSGTATRARNGLANVGRERLPAAATDDAGSNRAHAHDLPAESAPIEPDSNHKHACDSPAKPSPIEPAMSAPSHALVALPPNSAPATGEIPQLRNGKPPRTAAKRR